MQLTKHSTYNLVPAFAVLLIVAITRLRYTRIVLAHIAIQSSLNHTNDGTQEEDEGKKLHFHYM